jgi:hypothetical protein
VNGGVFTVQLRDWSPNARAELEALVRRYNGEPSGAGDQLTVRAVDSSSAETLFHALEGDPRVISTAQRDVQAQQDRFATHQAELEAAGRADRVAQLEAKVAEQAARIAELKRLQLPEVVALSSGLVPTDQPDVG